LEPKNGQSIDFPLNKDKNRSTSSVGGFWKIYAPQATCSELHPALKRGKKIQYKGLLIQEFN
jgi:hypothetical protein